MPATTAEKTVAGWLNNPPTNDAALDPPMVEVEARRLYPDPDGGGSKLVALETMKFPQTHASKRPGKIVNLQQLCGGEGSPILASFFEGGVAYERGRDSDIWNALEAWAASQYNLDPFMALQASRAVLMALIVRAGASAPTAFPI